MGLFISRPESKMLLTKERRGSFKSPVKHRCILLKCVGEKLSQAYLGGAKLHERFNYWDEQVIWFSLDVFNLNIILLISRCVVE